MMHFYDGDLSSLRFFGFLNLGAGVNNSERLYLINDLGGGSADIRDPTTAKPWSSLLDKFKTQINRESKQRSFELKYPISKVLSVKVGSKSIDASAISFSGSTLMITSHLVSNNEKLHVSYESAGSARKETVSSKK